MGGPKHFESIDLTPREPAKSVVKIQVCLSCGQEWKDDKGWLGPHDPMCTNQQYGWTFVKEIG